MYGQNIVTVYPARGDGGRTAMEQAGMQFLSLIITVGIAVSSGMMTGLIVQTSFFEPMTKSGLFRDHKHWDDVEVGDSITEHHSGAHDHAGKAMVHEHKQSHVEGTL